MPTPEQQLNTESNLQTLETELSLTKAEMEEFRKLPKEEQEKQKDEKLEKLKALQEKLEQAIQEAIRTGQADKAKLLLEQQKVEIKDFESLLDNDLETLRTEFAPFLHKTWKIWSIGADKIKNAVIEPIIIEPSVEDYQVRQDDIDASKFGEFTVNPDTQGLDWESLKDKIFIPDLSALNGKPLSEVAKYLIDNFSDKYKIPGIEFWKFMLENPDKVPADVNGVNLKDGNYYFNFGSLVRGPDGHWSVLCAYWDGPSWTRREPRLDSTWRSHSRVVLLEI